MTLLPKQSNNKNPIDLYGEIVDDLPGLICFGNRLGGYFNKQWRDYTGAIAGNTAPPTGSMPCTPTIASGWPRNGARRSWPSPRSPERPACAIAAAPTVGSCWRLTPGRTAWRWSQLVPDGDRHSPANAAAPANVQALSIQQDMLDASVDCIKVINHDGTLRHMNRSGSLALGLDPGQKSLACPGWGCCRPRSGAAAASAAQRQSRKMRASRD